MNTTTDPSPTVPWWRVGTVWLILGGPLAVIVAAIATAVIAWRINDPEVERTSTVQTQIERKDPLAPALRARNHAATPARESP